MGSCCDGKAEALESAARSHRRVLWIVLVINIVMFATELTLGIISGSIALVGDSLDMLGDAVTYGSSILVLGQSLKKKAKVAKLKAWIMLAFGLVISLNCFYRALFPEVPQFDIMLATAIAALSANLVCLYLLTSHKEDDINMRSVWICSRNDIIANSSVLLAAGAVFYFESAIPDIIVGVGLTILFTRSALAILKDAKSVES